MHEMHFTIAPMALHINFSTNCYTHNHLDLIELFSGTVSSISEIPINVIS